MNKQIHAELIKTTEQELMEKEKNKNQFLLLVFSNFSTAQNTNFQLAFMGNDIVFKFVCHIFYAKIISKIIWKHQNFVEMMRSQLCYLNNWIHGISKWFR